VDYKVDDRAGGQPPARGYPRRRGRRLLKLFFSLIIAAAVFGAGVAVGRGDLRLNGLSYNLPSQSSLNYSSVDQVYRLLKKDYNGNLNQSDLLNGAKSGLVQATGDPYTEFFNPKEAKDLNNELAGSFTGIGAELGSDSQNRIVVVSPLSGYPAEQAGLKPKDVIAAINGQSTAGVSVSAAVRKIRGPANSKVMLTIIRGDGQPFDVTLTRVKITTPSVKSSVDGNIGYLKVSQFTNDTADLAQKAVGDFKAKNVKGVVLDLRGDPGGYLNEAVQIASYWLPSGQTVVQERRGGTVVDTDKASGESPLKGLPTVVLIDSGSASASEIVAGALHDNHAATLVGDKTFGKGSVQQVEKLPDGSELKVTIARWYTPGGKNIDKQGITPDVSVSNSDADTKAGKDPQKDKAYEILRSKIQQ